MIDAGEWVPDVVSKVGAHVEGHILTYIVVLDLILFGESPALCFAASYCHFLTMMRTTRYANASRTEQLCLTVIILMLPMLPRAVLVNDVSAHIRS